MKVFFGCSLRDADKHIVWYERIIRFLKSQKCILTRDWIHQVRNRLNRYGNPYTINRSSLYKRVMRSLDEADVCIFDATAHTMTVGHQITYAVEHKKPTLVLMRYLPLNDSLKSNFFLGYQSAFLRFVNYKSENELKIIIKNFINKNRNSKKERLDIALDKDVLHILDEEASSSGNSRINIIKKIILES